MTFVARKSLLYVRFAADLRDFRQITIGSYRYLIPSMNTCRSVESRCFTSEGIARLGIC